MPKDLNFWDSEAWAPILIIGLLLVSMLAAHMIIRSVKPLRRMLIPSSVLAGMILLVISTVTKLITGSYLFDLPVFSPGENGIGILELVTYHCLGLGFVATALRSSDKKITKARAGEVFDTGVTTVLTYLIQAILGLVVTIIAASFITGLFSGSGLLLAFGFGQGTGQALNYGNIYETESGFVGGKSFGLTVAALGFLTANIYGVIYMNILKRKGKLVLADKESPETLDVNEVQGADEIPMISTMDKLTMNIAIVVLVYAISYGLMILVGHFVGDGLRATIFGFNFLFGTLIAILLKKIIGSFRKKGLVHHTYTSNFMLNRVSGLLFDIMIVAGIGAIEIDLIAQYWHVLLIMALLGGFLTFFYNLFVARRLFGGYAYEQFFAMFGMLTGTASTGMILLREVDPEFKTPAADNLIFQNLPAIVFGFPLMLLASYVKAGGDTVYITFAVLLAAFIVLNVVLFRRSIFKRRGASA